ncbi:MAG: O-antigen ligase family protein [Parcubacteria group bacterium]|jgi:O-antigen ligase
MLYKLLLLFCLYLPFQLALNASEGVDLASGRVFVLLLGILWLLKSLAQKKFFIPNKIQTLLLFSFLFLSAFSLVFAQNTDWAYRKLLFLLSFIPIYFVVASICHSERSEAESRNLIRSLDSLPLTRDGRDVKIIKFLVYGAGLVSLVGLFQFALQFFIGINGTFSLWQKVITPFLGNSFSQSVFQNPSWLVEISGNTYMRAIAFFPDPHMFSFYLGMLLPFAIALFWKNKSNLYLIISALILITDIFTFSRGGYLGLLAGLIFTLFIFKKELVRRFSLKKFVITNIFILIIAAIIMFPNPISQRLASSFDVSEGSNSGRLETWKQSLEVIKNNPLGVGIGNYALKIKPSANYREPIYSHNLYLDIAAETGILNALIFIWLIIVSILSFIRLGKNNKFYLAGAISLIIFSVHSIFETPLYSIHVLPLLLAIIALSIIKIKNE